MTHVALVGLIFLLAGCATVCPPLAPLPDVTFFDVSFKADGRPARAWLVSRDDLTSLTGWIEQAQAVHLKCMETP